ncbi:metal ABC transporter ATPase [Spirulina subsalsa FACHB-351]|uniref:Metal ABC transporter ATPase n=1 Tax=Spirulina subsalsa FACHB-351 TaxID=234711 RepID=A0ABT3LBZ9_9CYAN|nr:metal ABC transporter ATPase [Spirulina subsalsa]MCW6039026.1 metal ABC transporter ATPase [Spirulina subsalsa FACHB-351]
MEQTIATLEQPSPNSANSQQISEFLQEHGEVEMILPVILGLFVTSRFQLRGANALLVNLAVASLSRQVFRELKKPSSQTPTPPQPAPTSNLTSFSDDRFTIIHSVPGRIRLRIPQLNSDPSFAKRLERLLNADDQVIHVRVNRSASSIVIHYHSGDFSELELGLRLMTILESASQESESN